MLSHKAIATQSRSAQALLHYILRFAIDQLLNLQFNKKDLKKKLNKKNSLEFILGSIKKALA